jgi:hypothetical protein
MFDGLGASSIRLNWHNPGDDVDGYVIEHRPAGTSTPTTTSVSGSARERMFILLASNTSWCFRIKASNESGESPFSAWSCQQTWEPEYGNVINQFKIQGADVNMTAAGDFSFRWDTCNPDGDDLASFQMEILVDGSVATTIDATDLDWDDCDTYSYVHTPSLLPGNHVFVVQRVDGSDGYGWDNRAQVVYNVPQP